MSLKINKYFFINNLIPNKFFIYKINNQKLILKLFNQIYNDQLIFLF